MRLQQQQQSKAGGAEDCEKEEKRTRVGASEDFLQEKKEREEEESKIAMKVVEEEEAVKNDGLSTQPEFDSSLTESSKGGSESALSPEQSEDKDPGKYLSVLSYPIFTCP
jgi:hypothetical protein